MPRSRITTQFAFEDHNASVLQRVNRGVAEFKGLLFSPAGVIAGAGALATGLAAVTSQYLDNARAVSRVAASTKASTQAVSALNFAFERFGYDINDVDAILAELEIKTYDWRDGVAGVSAAFQELNLDLDEFDRLSPDRKLQEVARALADVESGSRRLGIADAIFGGDDARKVLAIAEDLDRLTETALRTGNTIDESMAMAAERTTQNLETIQAVVQGAGNRIGAAIVNWGGPILEGAGKAFGILPPEANLRTGEVIQEFVRRYNDARNAGASFGDALADPVIARLTKLLEEAGYAIDEILDLPNQARGRERFQDIILRDQTRDRLFGPLHPEDIDPEGSADARAFAVRLHLRQLEQGRNPAAGRGIGAADAISFPVNIPDINRVPTGILASEQFDRIAAAHLQRAQAEAGGRGTFAHGGRLHRLVGSGSGAVPVEIVGGRDLIRQARNLAAIEGLKAEEDVSSFELQRRAEAFSESLNMFTTQVTGAAGGFGGGGRIDGQGLIDASKNDPVRVTIAGVGGLNEGAGRNQRFREIRIDENELINRDGLVDLILAVLQDYTT